MKGGRRGGRGRREEASVAASMSKVDISSSTKDIYVDPCNSVNDVSGHTRSAFRAPSFLLKETLVEPATTSGRMGILKLLHMLCSTYTVVGPDSDNRRACSLDQMTARSNLLSFSVAGVFLSERFCPRPSDSHCCLRPP